MKRSLLGLIAVGALVAGPAMAADMPLKAPPAPIAPAFSWTGFYIGAQGGGGWGESTSTTTATSFCGTGIACTAPVAVIPGLGLGNTNISGGFGGFTAGANYQFNQIVVGIEGDWSWSDIDGSAACGPAVPTLFILGGTYSGTCRTKLEDFGTLTGRIGWAAWDRALLYVKGGGAWAHFDESLTSVSSTGVVGPAGSVGSDRSGYTIGGGIEYAFLPNWSFKVEYQHMDFGSKGVTLPVNNVAPFAAGVFNFINTDNERVDIVRAGINYRFNWGAGPVAARY